MDLCCICLNAGSLNSDKGRGVISPWIRELTSISKFKTTLRFCKKCKGSFFDFRYTQNDMASIYQDYRGQNYTKIRKYWEPWYSSTYDDVDNESPYSHERRRILKQFLNNHNISSAQIIVDVGGNMGEFIPELEDLKERLVLEISQKELPPNIRRIESLEEVGGGC